MCTQIITEIIKYCFGQKTDTCNLYPDTDYVLRMNLNRAFSNLDTVAKVRPFIKLWRDGDDLMMSPLTLASILAPTPCADIVALIQQDINTIRSQQPDIQFDYLTNGLNNMKRTYPQHTDLITDIITKIYSKD